MMYSPVNNPSIQNYRPPPQQPLQFPAIPNPGMQQSMTSSYPPYARSPSQGQLQLSRSGSLRSVRSSGYGSINSLASGKKIEAKIPVHPTSFRTGVNAHVKGGRRTPVEVRDAITTRDRYFRYSKGSLAKLDYDSYGLDDYRQIKSRDGHMRLPSGLGHSETNEWKEKVFIL